MKKIIAALLISVMISGSASALTVSDFVERYNKAVGKGSIISSREQFISDNVWMLSGFEERDMVIAVFNPKSAENPKDCNITSIALKHKPRCKPSVYLTNIAAAVEAVFPDIPETERLSDILRTMRQSEYYFGYSYWPKAPVPYNTEHMVQFVYQEETDYYTFLFSIPEDLP